MTRRNYQLAEYVFLLPQLLAVSPLVAVFLHMRRYGEAADFVYSFRLITLTYLLMMTAVVLFIWRPSLRQSLSFRRNLTRVTCVGMLALLPIPLATQVLSKYDTVSVQLFSALEAGLASVALLCCVGANLSCLVSRFRELPTVRFYRFDYLSIVVQVALLGLLIKWW
ncbi:MAG: hypothetical protein AAF465_05535 [Pseudomonadota bacterium]